MPVYEYICKTCGHQFEKIRPMSKADEMILCFKCQSPDTYRKLSRFNAHSEGGTAGASAGGCAGCSGGTCSTCHH